NSDITGIGIASQDAMGTNYVRADLSGKMSMEDWAKAVVDAYHDYDVDKIVVENNQGGDLVTNAIRAIDRAANVMGKHVSVSKRTRHEPVAALYSQGKVKHVGHFTD